MPRQFLSGRLATSIAILALFAPLVHAAPTEQSRRAEADQVLERYFEKIGGREKFATARGEYIAIEIRDPKQSHLPYYFELCFSYEDPRGATRIHSNNITLLSAYDHDKGWAIRKAPGQMAALKARSEASIEAALVDWRGNFEVLTHRLAKRDPDVYATMGEGPYEGWLIIHEKEEPVFRLVINEEGEPVQFERILDGTKVHFGPLVSFGDYSFPSNGRFAGTFNNFDFHIFRLIPESLTKAFTPPVDIGNPVMDCR